jgi:dsDNA-binding SOS-regulon protein
VWTAEAQEALDKLKQFLTKALILAPAVEREPLLLYVAATTQVVSAALVVEREEAGQALKVRRPVYFISEVLADSKTRYP